VPSKCPVVKDSLAAPPLETSITATCLQAYVMSGLFARNMTLILCVAMAITVEASKAASHQDVGTGEAPAAAAL
jgi:hypothetical protein